MGCTRIRMTAGSLTPEQAREIVGRDVLTDTVSWEDGGDAFICGKGFEACSMCGFLAEHLCDFPMGKGKTCDARLCLEHAIPAGEESARALSLDDMTARLQPSAAKARRRTVDALAGLEYCPAHWDMARRAGKDNP
jgi:hypothetical protein